MNHNVKYFKKNDAETVLEQAIEQDDAAGIVQAVSQGADPNTRGLYNITPLMMAVGKIKPLAAAELLRQGGKPNLFDDEKDNAVTLAIRAYKKEPKLLRMVLEAGGDPNTLFPDNSPSIEYFLDDHNYDGACYLAEAGADINARTRAGRPIIISNGIRQEWDAVWALLELGAEYDYPDEPITWEKIFSTPNVTPPDSPLWPYKVKVWKFLKQHNQDVPEKIDNLVGKKYWEWLKKKNLPKPKLE
jgi:hypothetical protein